MLRTCGAIAALAAFVAVSGAEAAPVGYQNFIATTDNSGAFPEPVVTIDDTSMPGFLSFSIGSTGATGDFTGFYFDTSGVSFSESDIVGESVPLAAFASNPGRVRNLGGGVNANGSYRIGPGGSVVTNPRFDAGLRIAPTDLSTTPFTFRISTSILTLADLLGDRATDPQYAFFRFRSVRGEGVTSGSAKLVGTAAPIPLPAAAWMLLAALGGLWALRRRAA